MTVIFISPLAGLRPFQLEMVSQTISETASTLPPEASRILIQTGGQI